MCQLAFDREKVHDIVCFFPQNDEFVTFYLALTKTCVE